MERRPGFRKPTAIATVFLVAMGCSGAPKARQDIERLRSATQRIQEEQQEATQRVFSILSTAVDTVDTQRSRADSDAVASEER